MAEVVAPKLAEEELLRMTADVVSAYVSNNALPTTQLAEIINAVYSSLKGLEGQVAQPQLEPAKPAVIAIERRSFFIVLSASVL